MAREDEPATFDGLGTSLLERGVTLNHRVANYKHIFAGTMRERQGTVRERRVIVKLAKKTATTPWSHESYVDTYGYSFHEDNDPFKHHLSPEEEGALLRRLGPHPHIGTFLALFHVDPDATSALVLARAGDGDMLEELELHGPIDGPASIEYIGQICSGLDYIHARSIVHLDIKPDNLALEAKEHVRIKHVRIIDFGLSASLRRPDAKTKRPFTGSLAYSADEVILEEEFGVEADIWSLAATWQAMLTSYMPQRWGFDYPDPTLVGYLARKYRPRAAEIKEDLAKMALGMPNCGEAAIGAESVEHCAQGN